LRSSNVVEVPISVHKERSAILLLPRFQDLLELCLHLWQLLGNTLTHLLFAKKTGRIALLSLLATKHKSRSIMASGSEIIAVLDQTLVLVDKSQSRSASLF
jgi:hypothetical protein